MLTDFGGLPALELERARARGVALQPLVAEIVTGGVRQHQLLVDHRADARGQAVEHEARREVLADRELDRLVVDRLDHALDVFRAPAELGQDESGREVEPDHPLQGEGHVLGTHRIAGVEGQAGPDLERDRAAVVADAVALGDAAHQLGRILGLIGHDPIVQLVDHLAAGELEHLGRIEADDVIDVLGDHQRVRRRFRPARRRQRRREQRRGRHATDADPGHDLPPADPLLLATRPPRATERVGRLVPLPLAARALRRSSPGTNLQAQKGTRSSARRRVDGTRPLQTRLPCRRRSGSCTQDHVAGPGHSRLSESVAMYLLLGDATSRPNPASSDGCERLSK